MYSLSAVLVLIPNTPLQAIVSSRNHTTFQNTIAAITLTKRIGDTIAVPFGMIHVPLRYRQKIVHQLGSLGIL